MLATLAQSATAFDPDSVTPGVVGFVATAVVAIAVCFLLFDMNRRVRRVKYREEVRAEIAAEQAAADGEGAAAEATGTGGSDATTVASSPTEPPAPERGDGKA